MIQITHNTDEGNADSSAPDSLVVEPAFMLALLHSSGNHFDAVIVTEIPTHLYLRHFYSAGTDAGMGAGARSPLPAYLLYGSYPALVHR